MIQQQFLKAAHRGLCSIYPENTIKGFQAAMDIGCNFVELDVIANKDNDRKNIYNVIVIVAHDLHLSRVTNIESFDKFKNRKRVQTVEEKTLDDWWVIDFTLSELQELRLKQAILQRSNQYDFLYTFSSLESVLNLNIPLLLEIKSPEYHNQYGIPIGKLILDQLNKLKPQQRIIVMSFDEEVLQFFKAEAKYELVQLIKHDKYDPKRLQDFKQYSNYLGADLRIAKSHDLVQEARAAGLPLFLWTYRDDDPEFAKFAQEAYKLSKEAYCIITEFPLTKLSDRERELIFNRIFRKACNQRCADCGANKPTWCSIDFGVFVCYNCSGAHRPLGQHISRVRSTQLDAWTQENIDMMEALGNELNEYWEARLPPQKKPDPTFTLEQMQAFVQDKYIKRLWVMQGVADPKARYQQALITGVPFSTKKAPNLVIRDDSIKTFYSDNGFNNQKVADAVKQFKTVNDPSKFATVSGGQDWNNQNWGDWGQPKKERQFSVDKSVNLLSPDKEKSKQDWIQQAKNTAQLPPKHSKPPLPQQATLNLLDSPKAKDIQHAFSFNNSQPIQPTQQNTSTQKQVQSTPQQITQQQFNNPTTDQISQFGFIPPNASSAQKQATAPYQQAPVPQQQTAKSTFNPFDNQPLQQATISQQQQQQALGYQSPFQALSSMQQPNTNWPPQNTQTPYTQPLPINQPAAQSNTFQVYSQSTAQTFQQQSQISVNGQNVQQSVQGQRQNTQPLQYSSQNTSFGFNQVEQFSQQPLIQGTQFQAQSQNNQYNYFPTGQPQQQQLQFNFNTAQPQNAQSQSWADAQKYQNNPFAQGTDILNLYNQKAPQQNKYDALKNNPFA